MSCAHLAPFLDDELADGARQAFAAHLDGCDPCREEVELDRAIRGALRAAIPGRHRPSPALEGRVRTALANVPRLRRAYLAAAALLIAAVGLVAWGLTRGHHWSPAQDMVHKHALFLAQAEQGEPGWEVSTPDREKLARWASDRLGYDVRFPSRFPVGAEFRSIEGVRIERINGSKAMMAFCQDERGRPGSLFAMPAERVDLEALAGSRTIEVEEYDPQRGRLVGYIRMPEMHPQRDRFLLVIWRDADGKLSYCSVQALVDPSGIR